MRKEGPIQLSKERKAEIGDLAAGMVPDFVIEKLAPDFYNRGVDNTYRYMKEATEEWRGAWGEGERWGKVIRY